MMNAQSIHTRRNVIYHNTQHRYFQTVDRASYQTASIIPGPSSNRSGPHAHLVFALGLLRQGEDGFDPPAACS
jgi:hypothetical protein